MAIGEQRTARAIVVLQMLPSFKGVLAGIVMTGCGGVGCDSERIQYGQSIAWGWQVAGIQQGNSLMSVTSISLFANSDPIQPEPLHARHPWQIVQQTAGCAIAIAGRSSRAVI